MQKVFNSHIFSRWFEEDVLQHGDGPRAASLSAAKHRFASFAKPMGRMLLHIKSFFRVLHRIASMREEADWARRWLANVTSHQVLVLALAADGADSLLQLCRYLDEEGCDPAVLNQEIGHFLDEIHVQFLRGKAWEISGYAKHVADILESGALYSLVGGQGRHLQLRAGAKEKALKDFQPWVRLCEATVRAEFPDFEVFNSMLVFNLAENESRRGAASSEVLVGLRRIALALDVDPHSLRQEWEALRPVAMAQKKMSQLDNRQAWKQAYDHVQKSSHMKNKYHLKALPVALRAYVCWTPSTFLGLI